jgi:putative transposase
LRRAVSPNSQWVTQQAKNFLMDAEDMDLSPKMAMRDNDTKFTAQLEAVFENSDATIKCNTPLSPNVRPHVERFIQPLQVECLDKFVIVAQRHLNHVCRQFGAWYNTERPHEARGHLPPAIEAEPDEWTTIRRGDVVCNMRLGGTLKSYSLWSA